MSPATYKVRARIAKAHITIGSSFICASFAFAIQNVAAHMRIHS